MQENSNMLFEYNNNHYKEHLATKLSSHWRRCWEQIIKLPSYCKYISTSAQSGKGFGVYANAC